PIRRLPRQGGADHRSSDERSSAARPHPFIWQDQHVTVCSMTVVRYQRIREQFGQGVDGTKIPCAKSRHGRTAAAKHGSWSLGGPSPLGGWSVQSKTDENLVN